jgi:pimeloyl-ACP methyl ester carboxylesterase
MLHEGAVLIVNGWGANASLWSTFCECAESKGLFFSSKVQVLDLDQAYSETEWIACIQKAISFDTLLIGWSLGGILAANAVAGLPLFKQPDALVLLNSAPCFNQTLWPDGMSQADFDDFRSKVVVSPSHTVKLFSYLQVIKATNMREDKKLLNSYFSERILPSRDALISSLRLLEHVNAIQAFREFNRPVLCIAGEQDQLMSHQSISKGAALNNQWITFKCIKGMSHLPALSYKSSVIEIISAFLKNRSVVHA